MRFTPPTIEVPGDREDKIMARSGECVGIDPARGLAVWRFGFLSNSEAAQAYAVHVKAPTPEEWGFMWVLCTIKTATVRATCYGIAAELPDNFRKVLDA